MRVGICYTKLFPNEIPIHPFYEAFRMGLSRCGDGYENIIELNFDWKYRLANCDLSVQICEGHVSKQLSSPEQQPKEYVNAHFMGRNEVKSTFRSQIYEIQKQVNHKRLVCETGFIKNDRKSGITAKEGYFQLGYDGMKGSAKCYNDNSPNDRWDDLNVSVKPWRKSGSHILILAQNINGPGACHIDIAKWWKNIIVKIREITDRPIKIRPHPAVNLSTSPNNILKEFACKEKSVSILEQAVDIQENFRDCWCAVALTTNSAVDAIIDGVPVITPDPMSMAYDVASHQIEEVNNPVTPDRTQWLYDLAYSQWSLPEIRAGIPWARLRRFAFQN